MSDAFSIHSTWTTWPLMSIPRMFEAWVRHDATAEHQHMVEPTVAELLDHPGEQGEMGTRQNRKPDRVGVLLQRRLGHLLRRLEQARVDHFEAGVAQRTCDHLDPPVVP